MAQMRLTEKTVATLPPPTDAPQAYYWDTDLKGFGVVVGRTKKTFVASRRLGKKLVKTTIGTMGEPHPDGGPWNVAAARRRAWELLGAMAAGTHPNAARRPHADGPTLRAALEFHIQRMERGENRRRKACSQRSIATTRGSVELHLAEYLDRPLVDLTADAITSVMEQIEEKTARRGGSNPANPPGRAAANRIIANVSAIWRSYDRRFGLPVVNPASRLQQAALKPRETRIPDAEFADWYAKVMKLENPVRRDLQLVALFTGIRSDGVRNLRWEDVDFDADLIQVARAKGDRPYSLPMVATVRKILERRKADNATSALLLPFGGDHGFVFPSLSRDLKRVIPVAEVKERHQLTNAHGQVVRNEDGEPVRVNTLPGIHVSRRTFNSVAAEIGIDLETRETLMNHSGRGVNVKHYVQPERFDHLRECAERIESALWERIKGARRARGRARRLSSSPNRSRLTSIPG
jgi:integrase